MTQTNPLSLARDALKRGDKAAARALLSPVLQTNPRSEAAWLLMSLAIDDPVRERQCLERVLRINPNNELARNHLLELDSPSASTQPADSIAPASPATPPPDARTPPPAPTTDQTQIRGPTSYAAGNLLPGERIVYAASVTPVVLALPALGTIAGCILTILLSTSEADGSEFCVGTLGLLVIAAIAHGIATAINLFTSEFVVTNRRVLIKTGALRRSSLELLLPKVEAVSVDQSLLGRIANYGTLLITGTGGMKTPFKNIARPMEFRRAVHQQIEES